MLAQCFSSTDDIGLDQPEHCGSVWRSRGYGAPVAQRLCSRRRRGAKDEPWDWPPSRRKRVATPLLEAPVAQRRSRATREGVIISKSRPSKALKSWTTRDRSAVDTFAGHSVPAVKNSTYRRVQIPEASSDAPNTGVKVQGWFADEAPGSDGETYDTRPAWTAPDGKISASAHA